MPSAFNAFLQVALDSGCKHHSRAFAVRYCLHLIESACFTAYRTQDTLDVTRHVLEILGVEDFACLSRKRLEKCVHLVILVRLQVISELQRYAALRRKEKRRGRRVPGHPPFTSRRLAQLIDDVAARLNFNRE